MSDYVTKESMLHQLSNLKQLTFEVTDACNLNCTYCSYGDFYNDYDKRENKKLPIKSAKILLDYLSGLWKSEYNVSTQRNVYISFYGGEPLLNMQFVKEIVDYVKALICPTRSFTFSMTTNAILLHEYMDYLVEKEFNLLISLDGNEKNTAYRVDKRNRPAFKRVVDNVNNLKGKYPKYFEQRVNFNAVLHNKNSVGDIYKFFKENYNKIPSIGELNNNGVKPDKEELFMQAYRNAQESLAQAENYTTIEKDMFMNTVNYQSALIYLHQYSNFVYKNYNELIYGVGYGKRIPTGTCIPFGKKMFVTVNGKILPCERIGQQFALGAIIGNKVSLDLDAIAARYNSYFSKLERQCSHCYNVKSCIQCVFNLRDLDSHPICYGFMDKSAFDVYEKNQLRFLQYNPEEYYRIMEEVIIE